MSYQSGRSDAKAIGFVVGARRIGLVGARVVGGAAYNLAIGDVWIGAGGSDFNVQPDMTTNTTGVNGLTRVTCKLLTRGGRSTKKSCTII